MFFVLKNMVKYAVNPGVTLLCGVIFIVLLFFASSCSMRCPNKEESYTRYSGTPLVSECEFQPACLWDTARWVQLSNGMEGVCTLHGIACPAFSKDHDRARNAGLSPTMVSDRYMQRLQDDAAGDTALDLGMYPTTTN